MKCAAPRRRTDVGGGVAWNRHVGATKQHPHEEQWRAVVGLVRDGAAFSHSQWEAYRAEQLGAGAKAKGPHQQQLLTETAAEKSSRQRREAATEAVQAKQKPAKIGKKRTVSMRHSATNSVESAS